MKLSEFVNTIDAFEKDIFLQLDFLKSFEKQKTIPSSNLQRNNVIFSGSGDSLVSAMLAESFSDGLVRAMDPLDLYKNKRLIQSKHIYFVSISGNTITSIKVAKTAKKSIAITSKPQSRLAKVTNEVVLLTAPTNNIFTAGSITFLESALVCMSLVKNITIPRNIKIFSKAKIDAKKFTISKRIFILGNLFTFPLAMYCAAKFYELLGYDAHYSKIEQFSHMELFSAKKGDTVIIFEEKNSHNKQLVKNLQKIGINVIHPFIPSDNISQMLYCTFFSQLIVLFEAKKKKKKDCHFVTAKNIRGVSNEMIY
ncbi:MAG: sugar isomerase [Nitrosopumilus sp.]